MRPLLKIVIVLIFMSAPAAELQAATIALKSETMVTAPIVRLRDMAAITGVYQLEQPVPLGSITISAAPPPGEEQILTLNTIVSALRVYGLDLSEFSFSGPRQVLVRRDCAFVTANQLSEAFSKHVSQMTGWDTDTFIASPPKNLLPLPVPVGNLRVEVKTLPDEDFCGSVLADFHISVDEKPYRTLTHRFTIERYNNVVVACRRIARDQQLTDADLEITKVEQTRAGSGSFEAKSALTGFLAARTIYPGTIIEADMVKSPPVVKKGQEALVVWEGNGFSVTTKGHVLEDGATDETVRVRLASRKILKAVVVDSKTLRIDGQESDNGKR